MIMADSHKVFSMKLHNLLVIFTFMFGIMSSWDISTILTEAIKEDVGRRMLNTNNYPGFISIDCGVKDDYINEETGISYKSDKDFINTGQNHNVKSEYGNNKSRTECNTLRSFPQGKKNCYTLKPEQGQNNYFIIRASFLYGNYDGKNEIPVFDLYLGADRWTTVQLPSNQYKQFYEIVYFFSVDTEYLCLVKTSSGIPFISALELRPSYSPFYNRTNHAALDGYVYDLGGSSLSSSRYKDDVYDRLWLPLEFPKSIAIDTSLNIGTQGSNSLPMEVLRTAIKPDVYINSSSDDISSLNYYHNSYSSDRQYYLLFHFAEIEVVARNRLREFSISVNGFKSKPIQLEYLKPYSLSTENWTIKGDFTVTLDATMMSDLPPILNAMEIYEVRNFSFSATDQLDVDAIMAIKKTYNISNDDWQGEPCLPHDYAWSGLGCSFSITPRIISMNLSATKLMGDISLSFSDLQAIKSLDLSNNELSGQVPEALAQLPNLKVLNLSANKLTGSIPKSLRDKYDSGSLVLSLNENPNLCIMDPCHREEKKKKNVAKEKKKNFAVPIIPAIGASVLTLVFLSTLIVFLIIRRRRQQGLLIKSMKNESFKLKNQPFTYSQIVRITNNFTNVLGEGGFGKVYLGTLDDNTAVAVKLLSPSSNQGYKEFRAEMLIDDSQARVTGLEYLHNGCTPPIVHRDLKSVNILLTETLQAKIADFGLSKIFMTENESHISTCPAGTPGYLDPEYRASGKLNKKSDVYSFGIILFELISGQPAMIRSLEDRIHILEWVSPIIDRGDIRSIIDPRLQGKFDVNDAWKVVEIAMSCAQPASMQRPDMGLVLTELKECMDLGRTQTASGSSLELSLSNVDQITIPAAR